VSPWLNLFRMYSSGMQKNNDITIWGVDGLGRFLELGPTDFNIVSIRSSYLSPYDYFALEKFRKNYKDIIIETFDDIQQPEPGWILPSKEPIKRILEWTKDRRNIAVHCTAGISRSPAIAYLAACQRCKPKNALEVLNPMLHFPNRFIVRLGSEILNDESILTEFNGWFKRQYDY